MHPVAPHLDEHYAALRRWLTQAMGGWTEDAEALLVGHRVWLEPALLRNDQPWLEWWPVGVETSARWLYTGIEAERYIIGTTLGALRESAEVAVQRLLLPPEVRAQVATLAAGGELPSRIQWGMGRSSGGPAGSGVGHRLYLEEGSIRGARMWAWEWGGVPVTRRAYQTYDFRNLEPLQGCEPAVVEAWQALCAVHGTGQGLIRRDSPGQAVAIHGAMARVPVRDAAAALVALGDAMALDTASGAAWLSALPPDAAVNGVSLGRDRHGRLHLSVYVVPDESLLPQPGPPTGDLRRLPGAVLLPIRHIMARRAHGWLLLVPADVAAPVRPVVRGPQMQVFASSAVPEPQAVATAVLALGWPPGPLSEGRGGVERETLPVQHTWQAAVNQVLLPHGLQVAWPSTSATFG